LILTAQRLRLLKRERERQSARWWQFDSLVKGGASFPEPGFALALYYQVSGDVAIGKRAVDWALSPASDDVRQLALVYDWCQPILTPQQSATLAGKMRGPSEFGSNAPVPARDVIFAAIATAGGSSHDEEPRLRAVIEQAWRGLFARSLSDGTASVRLPDVYPILELMHAIRDNLKIDLRDDAPEWFRNLPVYLVAANYPAPYRAPENEIRIPMDASGDAGPDLKRAALARAAGLAMVAFDNNLLENQYLQGWLMQDRFSMFTPFGAPYEFLWANPYQPGLSYYHLPLIFHDSNSGALFVRSSWDDDADWFGLYAGAAELFHAGRVTQVNWAASGTSKPEPLPLGDASVVFGRIPFQFEMQGGTVIVIGLKPGTKYLVETDDEEMREIPADHGGTFVLQYPEGRAAGVRVHEPLPNP